MVILATAMNNYLEIKGQVEAKWDIISMLCLLLFFLSVAAAVYAVMRPHYLVHKIIGLCVAFPVAYGVSYMAVHKGLAPEFYRMACVELLEKMGYNDVRAENSCKKKNPIRLSRVKRE